MTAISLKPAGIDSSASLAAARALALDEVTAQVTAVSLAGLEPSTIARTAAAIERAGALGRRASGITGEQGPALRRRAQLARIADAGGGSMALPGWEAAGWMNKVSTEVLASYRRILEHELQAMGKAKEVKVLYRRKDFLGAHYRRRFKSWKAMQSFYRGSFRTERMDMLRQIDKFNYSRRMSGAAAAAGGKVWSKTGKPVLNALGLGKGEPGAFGKGLKWAGKHAGKAISPITVTITSVSKGEPIEVTAQRAAAAGLGVGVTVGIGVVGGSLCAGAAVATAGVGAAACPLIVGGTAAVGGIVTTEVLDGMIDEPKPRPKPAPKPVVAPPARPAPSVAPTPPKGNW